jgi:hypothetical protein
MPDLKVSASQLKGMTDEKDFLLYQMCGIIVIFLHLLKPMKIPMLPHTALTVQRTARPPAGYENVEGEIRYLKMRSYIKGNRFNFEILLCRVKVQYLMYATHSLVGNTFIQVQDGHADLCIFYRMHRAKLTNDA